MFKLSLCNHEGMVLAYENFSLGNNGQEKILEVIFFKKHITFQTDPPGSRSGCWWCEGCHKGVSKFEATKIIKF